jgi:hypothetical protein
MILANATALAANDAIVDRYDVGSAVANGYIVFYDGTPPADADTALSGNNVLATVQFQAPAYGASSDDTPGAIASLLGVTLSDLAIDADGTPTFARGFNRDNNVVAQYTVDETGSPDILVNTTDWVENAQFDIVSFTHSHPES